MDHTALITLVTQTATEISRWESALPPFTPDPSLSVSDADAHAALLLLTERLRENYPFLHPRYARQMLKPPHSIAVAADATAMLINPGSSGTKMHGLHIINSTSTIHVSTLIF